MKKACKAMALFAASLETANDEWSKNNVPKSTLDAVEHLVGKYGGIDNLLMMLAVLITKPEDKDDEYPPINFLKSEG